ncbi:phosphopyruvate hydratase, partial [Candidatus Woesebacteria bacterium]|nr:phosphopyruvate hydratase [Candidatus Woesebacteria bacterium]
ASNNMPLYKWVNSLAQSISSIDAAQTLRIPAPMFNMINGGLHASGNLDFQEFLIVPATSKPYSEALRSGAEVYHMLEESLSKRGAIHSVGDEGGFAPNLFTNADALAISVEAANTGGYQIGQDFFLGLDVAANNLFRDGSYSVKDQSDAMNSASFASFYEGLAKEYRLTYLEDPLGEDDWDGWIGLTAKLGGKLLVAGDDLLATNPERIKQAIEKKACNAILVKPSQIGTVTETLQVIKQVRAAGWKVIVSQLSRETNDWFIADFAVGVKADYVKFGAPARGERVAKYNRLSSIETELAQQTQ